MLVSYLTQKTLKNIVNFNGIALHSGKNVNISIKPAEPNFGIVFKRVDLTKDNLVYPNFMNVTNTSLNTTIANEAGVKVSTIEHLMGALFGLGIDNALVEIDNDEVPILDGSAKDFIDKIIISGIAVSHQPIKIIKINRKVEYQDRQRFISVKPSTLSLDIDFELKYKNTVIGNQRNKVKVYEDDLTDIYNSRTFCLYEDIELIRKNGLAKGGSLEIDFEINFNNELIKTQKNNINIYMDDLSDMYNSRTFCLFEDIEKLKNMNLAQGGSLDNAIVVKQNKILNKEKLRNKKEFVNHKILDCLGDLYLSGFKMVGKVTSCQGGHNITNQGLRKLLSNNRNFSIIELKEKNIPHSFLNRNILKSIA